MPYITSFLSDEKTYVNLSNNVSNILNNFFDYYSSHKGNYFCIGRNFFIFLAFMFNGKKISANLILNEVEHLKDNHNIYFVQKTNFHSKEINLSEIRKYQNFLTLISSKDLEVFIFF